jgi:pyridinium-3,5-biscarboxylic acid mononucleotide sulfurtransferase
VTVPAAASLARSLPGTRSPDEREARLRELVASYGSVLVAYSGGADSAYLGWVATQVLGQAALCVTADSASYPDHHRQMARRVAQAFAFHHEVVETGELDRPEYRANPTNRCYYCKHELYTVLTRMAAERGVAAVADGSNADDRGDYRPGRAAAREFGVRSPLDEVGLTKADIRELSRRAGLPTWDEPASACLSSRIPYHSEVTPAKLRMIERAEAELRALGFRVCRVRHHELAGGASGSPAPLARLELGAEELARVADPALRERVASALRALGYAHVTVDLQGYRMGSLNDGLSLRVVP